MKVCNWDKWQTFRKDRGAPPWIKVHRNLLTNEEWVELSDSEKGQLVSIWMLAADKDGVIPDSAKVIQRMCMLDDKPNLNRFIELGFLSTTCQPLDNQDAHIDAPEESRGEESRVEESKPKQAKDLVIKSSTDHMLFAEGMYSSILKVAPKTKKPNFVKWADDIRLMNENDKLELAEMANVFRWVKQDSFWKTNILSPAKFRKQYSVLHAKWTSETVTEEEPITDIFAKYDTSKNITGESLEHE